jgi:hypothetical protein
MNTIFDFVDKNKAVGCRGDSKQCVKQLLDQILFEIALSIEKNGKSICVRPSSVLLFNPRGLFMMTLAEQQHHAGFAPVFY